MSTQTDLVEILEELGVEIRNVRGDEINGRCPVHHKVKGRPSTRYSWYLNIGTGTWYCHSCQSRGNLSSLLAEVAADPAILWHAQSFIITSGIRRLTAEEAVYNDTGHLKEVDWLDLARFGEPSDKAIQFRKLERDVVKRYGVRWETENNRWVLPIVGHLGELRGWQLKGRGHDVKNYPTGVNTSGTLFGVERAFAPVAMLVESPLDVVRFHSIYEGGDISCVAGFGVNTSKEQLLLLSRKFDGLILALDNDLVGKKETAKLVKTLPSFRKGLYVWEYGDTDIKDIGEMTDGQIIKGLANRRRVG